MTNIFEKVQKERVKKFFSVIAIFFLILSLGISAFETAPKKALAQFGVPVNETPLSPLFIHSSQTILKEGGLDTIAWTLAKLAIQQMTRSLVNWINSGFQGNPAFIQNPKQFFSDLADEALGQFLQDSGLGFLCSPFQKQIRINLIRNHYGLNRRSGCSLSSVLNNINNFNAFVTVNTVSNNRQWSWSEWYGLAADPSGNPYSIARREQENLDSLIAGIVERKNQEINIGSGFLSWRDCSQRPAHLAASDVGSESCPIVTPGKVIVDQLNTTLGAGVNSLVTADEINEIISALFSQLLGQVLGGGGGLFSVSQPSPSFNGLSYLDVLNSQTASNTPATADIKVNGSDAPVTILSGNPVNISWTSTNATGCIGVWNASTTPLTPSGVRSVVIIATQTVTLSCSGPSGTSLTDGVVINALVLPTADLKVGGSDGPVTVLAGNVDISWASTNATGCTGFWNGTTTPLFPNGSGQVVFTADQNATLSCSNINGTSPTDNVFVDVI